MLEGRRIVLDPGHGGESEGAIAGEIKEKDVNLEVALLLKKFLEEEGAIVFMTRDSDKFVSLKDRVAFAEAVEAEVFLSIHHNASYDDRPNQVEVYYRWCDECPSQSLAQFLTDSLSKELELPARIPYPATYTVLRNRLPLSVLTEAYYLKYHHPELIEREARGLLEGLKSFFNHGYPSIRGVDVRENVIELHTAGTWDSLISSAHMNNKRLLLEKKEGKALVHLTAGSGNLRVVLRNYAGIPSEPLEMTINNVVSTYVMDIYPGIKQIPNLISIYLYDIYGLPIGDGQEVLVRVNGEEALFYTVGGRISFVASVEADKYEVEIEVQGRKFSETLHLADGRVYYAHVKGAWDGFAIGQKRTYPIFADGSIFSPEKKLKIIAIGYQSVDVELEEGRNEIEVYPLYEGVFHRKKIFIAYDGLKDLAYELSSMLWFAGSTTEVESYENELEITRKAVEFDGDIVVYLKRSKEPAIGYYEMDEQGKRLAGILSAKLQLFSIPVSDHLLIQPFGARVMVGLESGGQKVLSALVDSLYRFLKGGEEYETA